MAFFCRQSEAKEDQSKVEEFQPENMCMIQNRVSFDESDRSYADDKFVKVGHCLYIHSKNRGFAKGKEKHGSNEWDVDFNLSE